MAEQPTCSRGFTLIELMMVVAIVGILAGIGLASYQHFMQKAKGVEAEVALAEIQRLQELYRQNAGVYSNDLQAIGFSPVPPLKYFAISVHLQNGGAAYQALALPLAGMSAQMGMALIRTPDGQVGISKGDPAVLTKQLGISSRGQQAGISPAGQNAAGGSPSGGRKAAADGCRNGGDATVAEDGLLDMNFCLEGSGARSR